MQSVAAGDRQPSCSWHKCAQQPQHRFIMTQVGQHAAAQPASAQHTHLDHDQTAIVLHTQQRFEEAPAACRQGGDKGAGGP